MNKKKTLIIEPIIRKKKTHKNIKIGVHVTLTHSGEAGINKKQHTEIANQSVIRKYIVYEAIYEAVNDNLKVIRGKMDCQQSEHQGET